MQNGNNYSKRKYFCIHATCDPSCQNALDKTNAFVEHLSQVCICIIQRFGFPSASHLHVNHWDLHHRYVMNDGAQKPNNLVPKLSLKNKDSSCSYLFDHATWWSVAPNCCIQQEKTHKFTRTWVLLIHAMALNNTAAISLNDYLWEHKKGALPLAT